ncbi:MAG: superoxide dismutase [Olpidium bornovanus]|uniref:Superoxide dismutase 1 copper chaperone n=1 Tax=Olpidium bornovanus TaxID=278681 RepID=A0A8H7ZVL9_9FUNG|nr:MAG: superoxide dismutase [Olpidium bornovanus]
MRDLKIELSVDMKCDSCTEDVARVLKAIPGLRSFDIDLEKKTVLVEGSAAPSEVYNKLKETGRTVIVRGQGSAYSENIGAAVCIFDEWAGTAAPLQPRQPKGLARFVQVDKNLCLIDVTVEGLAPGPHALCVHELGDFTHGPKSTGDCFDMPSSSPPVCKSAANGRRPGENEAVPRDPRHNHAGDVATILVDANGRANAFTETTRFGVYDVIGRSLVIAELRRIPKNANAWEKGAGVLGGIIARSAGLFENTKVVCACSGKTLWEEAKETATKQASL